MTVIGICAAVVVTRHENDVRRLGRGVRRVLRAPAARRLRWHRRMGRARARTVSSFPACIARRSRLTSCWTNANWSPPVHRARSRSQTNRSCRPCFGNGRLSPMMRPVRRRCRPGCQSRCHWPSNRDCRCGRFRSEPDFCIITTWRCRRQNCERIEPLFMQFSETRLARLLPLVLFVRGIVEPSDGNRLRCRQRSCSTIRTCTGRRTGSSITARWSARHRRRLSRLDRHNSARHVVRARTGRGALQAESEPDFAALSRQRPFVQRAGRQRSAGAMRRLLRQAIGRIAKMEARTGLEVARVMAPPHGACSETAITEMADSGFEAGLRLPRIPTSSQSLVLPGRGG